MRVLVVTPKNLVRAAIVERLSPRAAVDSCATFESGRARLQEQRYDRLFTGLRLGQYNGLHLVHLAHLHAPALRSIVFDAECDPFLASDVRDAGAFFEHASRVAQAAPAYLLSTLPGADRRDPTNFDRRGVPRGGRRAADLAVPMTVM